MTTASDIATAESKKLVIIESPCSGSPVEYNRNIDYLSDALIHSLNKAEAPIASHGLFAFSALLDDDIPDEREAGLMAGLAWYRVAQLCVVYQDYGISPGMARGIALAEALGIPVEYRNIKKQRPD